MTTPEQINLQCPLCQADNQCMAGTDYEASCWCHSAVISKLSLQGIPAQSKGKVCICPDCADAVDHPVTNTRV